MFYFFGGEEAAGVRKHGGRKLTYFSFFFSPAKLVRSYEIVIVEVLTEIESAGTILASISYEMY